MIDQVFPRRGDTVVPDRATTRTRDYRIALNEVRNADAIWSLTCHYCGFEPEADQTPRTRCPKCGGSAWELTPVPGSLLKHCEGGRGDACTARLRGTSRHADHPNQETQDEDLDDATCESDAAGTVLFRVRCSALQVYLLFGPDPGRPRMLPLHQAEHDEWQTRLHLPPGVYRYRFYIDDGTRLVYVATSDLTGNPSPALDGRLLVPRLRSA